VSADRNTEKQKRFFDERAGGHDEILFRSRWPRNQLLKARLLGDLLLSGAGAGPIVELGCGTGQVAEAMLDADPEMTYLGIDLSDEMVRRAGRRLSRFGARARTSVTAGGSLGLPAGAAAGAFGIDVLHHLPDPVETLRELGRSVARGGRVVFLESNPKFPLTTVYALAHREEHAVLRFSRRLLKGWFESAGYREVSVELGRLFTPPGPPAFVPLYDALDSGLARIPGVRALAIYYVASGVVPG
jgi:SAM-dependent methyltransferase